MTIQIWVGVANWSDGIYKWRFVDMTTYNPQDVQDILASNRYDNTKRIDIDVRPGEYVVFLPHGGSGSGTSDRYEIRSTNTEPPPTTTNPPDVLNPYGATHRIEINLPNDFVDALVRSGDFYARVGTLCQYTGYELKNIVSILDGVLYIDVKKVGSWSTFKLVGAIVGIIAIVLLAIFSGSVVVAALAVGGAFVAIHYVVKSFINGDIISDGQKNILGGMETLKDLIPIIQDDTNLSPDQKEQLIGEIVSSITRSQEDLVGLVDDTTPDAGSGSGLFAGISLGLILALIAAYFLLSKGKK